MMNHYDSNSNSSDAHSTNLMIGNTAPNFQARSTIGEVLLSDYRGKWVLMFCHPADFTPVCTTEFISLARTKAEFDKLDVQLLGLSIDSIFSHRNWVEWMERHANVTIDFPIIEDISMTIAKAYHMIDNTNQNTTTVRACIFIDPEQTIQAFIHYPMHIGRSVEELLRVQKALINTKDSSRATPANWKPGDNYMNIDPEEFYNSGGEWLKNTINTYETKA
jgi:peroxiredoxin (alkyl hydroperoxide reductase subunit C)